MSAISCFVLLFTGSTDLSRSCFLSGNPYCDFQISIQILIQIITSDLRYLNLHINPKAVKLMANYFLNYIQDLCKGVAVFILLIVVCVE